MLNFVSLDEDLFREILRVWISVPIFEDKAILTFINVYVQASIKEKGKRKDL